MKQCKNCCWRIFVIRNWLYVQLHSAGWWFDDEVTDLPSTNKLLTKVIQEVVSSEVSMLNHAVMNKKQGDQMQFSLEKED